MKDLFGKLQLQRVCAFCRLLALCLLLAGAVSTYAADPDAPGSADARTESLMAGLSDEQVRQLLIQELRADAQAQEPDDQQLKGPAVFLARLLIALSDEHDGNRDQIRHLFGGFPQVGPDLYKVFLSL